MHRRAVLVVAATAALWSLPTSVDAGAPGFLTLSFGRTQWVTTRACERLPNTVDLGRVAAELDGRGLVGTGNVVTDRTPETGLRCWNGYVLQPGWSKLARLRDERGWTFVSASRSYPDFASLTPEEQRDESCGSLPIFEAHGHLRAWGLFATPNDTYSEESQANVVSTCFAYGRRYDDTLPLGLHNINVRSRMAPPWFANTSSLFGGSCNDATLPCSDAYLRRYGSVTDLRRLVNVPADMWFNLQAYRFVTGAHGTLGAPGMNWDCTSPDWHAHWASASELYCWVDYRRILNAIPDSVVVTDPASVAEAWGRVPDGTEGTGWAWTSR